MKLMTITAILVLAVALSLSHSIGMGQSRANDSDQIENLDPNDCSRGVDESNQAQCDPDAALEKAEVQS